MKIRNTAFAAGLAFAALFATSASAKCGPSRNATPTALSAVRPWALKIQPRFAPAPGREEPPAAEPSIVGLWSVQIVADGQVVDTGFDMWLSDGTEILNDSTAPASGAVCIGAWTKTAPFTYQLKHPSYVFDDANVNLIGIVMIRETVTLGPKGGAFSGDFTVDTYDLMGNQLDHETGQIQGLRIAVTDDPKQTGGIPGLPVFSNN